MIFSMDGGKRVKKNNKLENNEKQRRASKGREQEKPGLIAL